MSNVEGNGPIAELLKQIDNEYVAAQRGLRGLASGASRHAFIHARMERVANYAEALGKIVGSEEAIRLVCQRQDAIIR